MILTRSSSCMFDRRWRNQSRPTCTMLDHSGSTHSFAIDFHKMKTWLQLKKTWNESSSSIPHTGHVPRTSKFLFTLLVQFASESVASLHAKDWTFGGAALHHIKFHASLVPSGRELVEASLKFEHSSLANLYALHTVKTPLFSGAQATKSSSRRAEGLIFWISTMSTKRKYWFILFRSQFSWMFSSSETHFRRHLPQGVIRPLVGSRAIHRSRHIRTFWPFPILHTTPFFRTSKPWTMACHVGDGLLVKTVSNKPPFGKYFALNNLAHKLLGNSSIGQAWRARSTWLKRRKSLKPKPPCFFGLVILSHAYQCVFLFSFSAPQK